MLVSFFSTCIQSGLNCQVNGKSIEVGIFLVINEDSLSSKLEVTDKLKRWHRLPSILLYYTFSFIRFHFPCLSYTRGQNTDKHKQRLYNRDKLLHRIDMFLSCGLITHIQETSIFFITLHWGYYLSPNMKKP